RAVDGRRTARRVVVVRAGVARGERADVDRGADRDVERAGVERHVAVVSTGRRRDADRVVRAGVGDVAGEVDVDRRRVAGDEELVAGRTGERAGTDREVAGARRERNPVQAGGGVDGLERRRERTVVEDERGHRVGLADADAPLPYMIWPFFRVMKSVYAPCLTTNVSFAAEPVSACWRVWNGLVSRPSFGAPAKLASTKR